MATSLERRKLLGILIGATLKVPKIKLNNGPPSAVIVAPRAGSVLNGTVNVQVATSDNDDLTHVELWINGALQATQIAAPYLFSWDSTSVANGPVTLLAKAIDAAGNAVQAKQSNIVSNVLSPTDTATLSIASSDPCDVLVYPLDHHAASDGSTPLQRLYAIGQRVWLSAALRSGDRYFVRWEKDGASFDAASTTTLVMDADHSLRAIYTPPTSNGISVFPGTDTLRAALRANPASGTTFYLRAGVHRFTTNVTPASGDTIIGEPGAVLRGSKVLTLFEMRNRHWIAPGQKQKEPPRESRYPLCKANSTTCIQLERVYRDGGELNPVATLDDLVTGTFFFDYATENIHLFDDPNGHLIEATVGVGGITGFGTAQVNVTVRNLVFEQFGGGYVAGQSHNCLKVTAGWLVEACEFRNVPHAIVAGGGAVIRNCYIHDIPQYGITGTEMLVEGCVLERINTGGFDVWNDAGPSKLYHSLDARWRGNLIRDNQGNAIWFDTDNMGILVENNRIERNVGMGVDNEVNCGATIRYNLIRDNNTSGYIQGLYNGGQVGSRSSCNVEIYGNEVVALGGENGLGVRASRSYTGTVRCSSAPIYSHDVSVHDNVFRLSAGSLVGTIGGSPGYTAANNIKFSANTYHLPDLSAAYWRIDGGPLLTKEQWQAAGQDRTGTFLRA